MKPRALLLAAIAVTSSAAAFAAEPRVSLAGVTLEAPAGWKASTNPDGSATLVDPGAQISWRIFPTEPASDLDAWFDDAWAALAKAHAQANGGDPLDTETEHGLTERARGALLVEANGTRHIVILAAISDGKRVVPTLVEFADVAAFGRAPEINAPAASILLLAKSPAPKSAFARGGWRYPLATSGVAPTPAPTATAPTKKLPFLGKWAVGQSAYNSNYSVSYGSRIYQYEFIADGTYRFHSEAWGGTFNSNWRYIIDEKGKWTASGDQLTVEPTWVDGVVRDLKGAIQKKGGPKLEKTTYRFQTTYFSGLQETQLVLTPPGATDRDGAFASNPSFPRSYLLRSNYAPAFRYAP